MNWRHGAMARGLAPRMVYRGLFLLALCCAAVPVHALTVDEAEALYMRGEYAAALDGFRAAAAQQSAKAQFYLGEMHETGRGVPLDKREAFRWYRLAAEQGNAAAQYAVGLSYTFGQVVLKDEHEAVRWFRSAAEQRHAEAQFWLGMMFAKGQGGVPKDEREALRLYGMAARQGHESAMIGLGEMHETGRGVPIDRREALRWYRLAAEQGNAWARFLVGQMYEKGKGTPKDEREAVRWYRLAAKQGVAEAQLLLGLNYEAGRGVPLDNREALRWYRLAAEQGNASAWFLVGQMYEKGKGTPKDEREAMRWFRSAAEAGMALAQSQVGLMYANGQGVSRNYRTAYFWWLLSSAQGDEAATRNRDVIEGKLTADERAAAQAAAREWRPKSTGTAAAPSAPSDSPASSAADAAPAVTGTAFRIARNQFVTNHHVVRNCHHVQVDAVAAQVKASDPRSDLALLTASVEGATVKMRGQRPSLGEGVVVAGFPLQGLLSGFQLTTGTLSSFSGPGGDTTQFQITAPVQAGNSGGPVLDGSGRLLGVVVSKLNALKTAKLTGDIPQNVNFAISANAVRSFLDANGVDYETSSSDRPLPTPAVARQAQAYTVRVACWQ